MNKWMNQCMTGLIFATAAVSVISQAKEQVAARKISNQPVDAVELAGGSKLKDRRLTKINQQQLEIVRVSIEA